MPNSITMTLFYPIILSTSQPHISSSISSISSASGLQAKTARPAAHEDDFGNGIELGCRVGAEFLYPC